MFSKCPYAIIMYKSLLLTFHIFTFQYSRFTFQHSRIITQKNMFYSMKIKNLKKECL